MRPAVLASALALLLEACSGGPERPLRLVFAAPPETLDPQRHTEDFTRAVLAHFYEGLVELDANFTPRPRLAVDWTNPSETCWRLRLRPGVRFHDGSAFGAEDVRHTLERARRIPGSGVEADLRAISEVRVVDDLTVELVTDRPRPLLLVRLAATSVLPRSTPDAEIVRPIGTGPWRFRPDASAADRGRVAGERFEGYWGARPSFGSFVIEALPGEPERARAAQQADLVTPYPEGVLPVGARFRVLRSPTVTVSFLACRIGPLPGGPSPFADIRVRRALAAALDRDAVARVAQGEPAPQLVVAGVHGYDSARTTAARDLELARRLLREAGFPAGLETRLGTSPRGREVGAEIARQAAEAGFRLEISPRPWPELLAGMRSGELPLSLASWTASSGDASSVLEPLLASPGRGGSENTTGYASAALDRALEQASVEMRPQQRGALLVEAMGVALDDLPLIPLFSPSWTYALRRGLLFEPRPDLAVSAERIRAE
jgi:peptide/nickel transport system substrate-binding protein